MKVNKIFYSLQGEGRYAGTPAVFIRLSGCNLHCAFCDTQHDDGREMSEDEILEAVEEYACSQVVITGGEPLLQLYAPLVVSLQADGFFVQIETNGTRPLPAGCRPDWITCSPKTTDIQLDDIDELKVVYWGQDITPYTDIEAREYRLQPLDTGDAERNREIVKATVAYCLEHPDWSLSLQTHKIIGIE